MFRRLAVIAFLLAGIVPAFAQSNVTVNWQKGTTGNLPVQASLANPLPVTAGANGLGNVGGFDTAVSVTPTVQAAQYVSGNAIGGLQTVAFFRTTTQPSGILNNIRVASQGGSTTALTLYIFNANPSASTCTDKVAFVLAAADTSKLIATIPPVLTPALIGVGTTVTMASQQQPVSVKNTDSPATVNLYVCAVYGGTVTPAGTADLVFKFAGIQD